MGGTTEEMMMARTSAASTLPMAKRLRKSTPYSSTVCVRMVATRQCAISRGDALPISYTPRTVLVLPTSRTRSISPPRGRTHAAGDDDAQSAVGADPQETTGIEAIGCAGVTSVLLHVNPFPVRVRRSGLHALHDGFKAKSRRPDGAGHGPHQSAIFPVHGANQCPRQLHARPFAPTLQQQRGGRGFQAGGKALFIHVDTNPDHGMVHAGGLRAHLGEDAAELPFVEQHVVGPAN